MLNACGVSGSARPGSRYSDHLVLPHMPDLVGGAAEPLAIDRLGIRAENRGASQWDLAVRHPQGPTRHDDRPAHRMRDPLHHPALMQIRIMQQLERGEDCAAGDTGAGDDTGYLTLGARRRLFCDGRIHDLLVLGACGAVDHTRIAEQVLAADRLH